MDELAELVCERLGGDLSARRMFGGSGLFRDGTMIGLVYDGVVYAKTNDESRARFEAAGMRPFNPRAGQTFPSFWSVPPDAGGELSRWFVA